MSGFDELNGLYIKYGVGIEPGTDIDWRTYQIKGEHNLSLVNIVKEQTDSINRASGCSDTEQTHLNPFCNPVIRIFHKLDFVVRYFCGEFEIQTSNKALREEIAGIWFELIKGWYFGAIYIGYGEDFEAIDRVKFEKEGKDFRLEGIPGKFRLFTRSGKGTFHSILSGQSGINLTPEQRLRMVKCDFNGGMNWMHWWNLWTEWIIGMERFKSATEALSKNCVVTPKSEAEYKNVIAQFRNTTCMIRRGGTQDYGDDGAMQFGKTKFDEMIFMPRENPMAILEGVQRVFELNAAHLGFAGRLAEQKKERVNAGENYPHQKVVSNVITYYLTTLNYLFDQMRLRFGDSVIPKDLKIIQTNQAFAQGLPTFQEGGSFNRFNGASTGWNTFQGSKFEKPGFRDNRGND